jgi:selenocysteine lyase/cysteine desulfurase
MSTISRRDLLWTGAVATAGIASVAAAGKLPARPATAPDKLALDESYWRQVAAQYDITADVIQLENGNWGSMSLPVLAAYEQYQRKVNRQNSYYARREYLADHEKARARIATAHGVSVDEIALTRNATEALQALIGSYNRLRAGDAVLFADLDYDAMQMNMQWLAGRRGVKVVKIDLPEPATHQGVIDAYAAALKAHPQVRMMLLTHVSHRTGLLMPVNEIARLARRHNVDVILDSAHAWGQVDFRLPALGVDFVGLNAHKWIGNAIGVGVMYIRRERLAAIDPYMGDTAFPADDIRARVHTGTSNFAAVLSATDALDFHEAIGTPAKAARLRHLRDLWAEPLREHPEWEILTPQDRRMYAGITSFRRRGRTGLQENIALARRLLAEAKIFTVHRPGLASGACVRVTPAVFNNPDQVAQLLQTLSGPAARW